MTPQPTPPEREGDVDHDLLTYGEVGARLHEEVCAQERLVAELEANAGPELEAARIRLAALREAADRNRRQPITDSNFEAFFGYQGTARRNT
jgi:hypothetical protein